MRLNRETGLIDGAEWLPSPNFDERDPECEPEAIIIHSISLPPGIYGGDYIARFFQNKLSENEDPYFKSMAHLTVSAHFLIARTGYLSQFVSTERRAWHAGESTLFEKSKVNNFSIGIELEGFDEDPQGYTEHQYQMLATLTLALQRSYPAIKTTSIFAHSDIAPGRKPDPGRYFEWNRYLNLLDTSSI